MTFRVTDLMIEAAAKKSAKKKQAPCTRCTQCTKTGVSTCTADSNDKCGDCGNGSKKRKALSDLHGALRETLMAQPYL